MDRGVRRRALEWADAEGLVRDDAWQAGVSEQPPRRTALAAQRMDPAVTEALDACLRGETIDADGMLSLFSARGADVEAVCAAADTLRQKQVGSVVSYVINRNINYTNVCQYSCRFCAFSKGGGEVASGRAAYDLDGASCTDGFKRRPRWAPQRCVCREVFTLTIPGRPIWTSSRR